MLAVCFCFFVTVNFAFLVWKIWIITKLKKQDAIEKSRDTITTLTSTITTGDGSPDPGLCSPKL